PSSQGLEPPGNPARFTLRAAAALEWKITPPPYIGPSVNEPVQWHLERPAQASSTEGSTVSFHVHNHSVTQERHRSLAGYRHARLALHAVCHLYLLAGPAGAHTHLDAPGERL